MPKARPVLLNPEVSGLRPVQTAHSHTWLILTWVQSQWGTEGTGLELQQNPGHEMAAEAPGDMQGGKASGGPGAPDSSFCYLESCLSHFQPGPVVIHH